MRCSVSSGEESWKYDTQRSIFDELWGVSSGENTVECLILLLKQKLMILEGQIQDAKMTSFSSDFHTLIKH